MLVAITGSMPSAIDSGRESMSHSTDELLGIASSAQLAMQHAESRRDLRELSVATSACPSVKPKRARTPSNVGASWSASTGRYQGWPRPSAPIPGDSRRNLALPAGPADIWQKARRRHSNRDSGATIVGRTDREFAADQLCSLLHAYQAESPRDG